jgi:hypothetical protein
VNRLVDVAIWRLVRKPCLRGVVTQGSILCLLLIEWVSVLILLRVVNTRSVVVAPPSSVFFKAVVVVCLVVLLGLRCCYLPYVEFDSA